MSFLGEIRRRKVFQVAAVYAVVAWLTIQIIDVVADPLSLPDWLDTVVIVLFAAGFPIAVLLAWAFELTPQGLRAASEAVPGDIVDRRTGQRFSYISQGLILLAVGFLVIDQYLFDPSGSSEVSPATASPAAASETVRRTSIILGSTQRFGVSSLDAHVALSPDGRKLVYAVEDASRAANRQLYVRELDQLTTRPIEGTFNADDPFFSPDGEWVGFFEGGELHTISLQGGAPRVLAGDVRNRTGGFWSADDSILYTAVNSDRFRLHRVAAVGGQPELLRVDTGNDDLSHVWPYVLPDGEHALVTVRSADLLAIDGRVVLLSMETGNTRTLIEGGYNARYTPTGHIVFMRSGSLWAVPFSLRDLEKSGPEVPVIDGVQTSGERGQAVYAFSNDGLLVYLPGADTRAMSQRSLTWVGRGENEQSLALEARHYRHPQLSPDGERVAISIRADGNDDVWVIDLDSRTPSRFTFHAAVDETPLWTPDGQNIVFRSERNGGGIFVKAADGPGAIERLTTSSSPQYPEAFSPDGRMLVFRQEDPVFSLQLLTMDDELSVRPLTGNSFSEHASAISPDGRWIAYDSHENGGAQVYVRPFPNVEDGQWQISPSGGTEPHWHPMGGELFYTGNGRWWVVPVETESGFSYGLPSSLVTGNYVNLPNNERPNIDVSPDGQRFLMMRINDQNAGVSGQTVLVAVENWFEELGRLSPPSQ